MSNEENLENQVTDFSHGNIHTTDISHEVRKDFLEYAMSVIVARALPDLRDGLKPVHRRIIYAMNDLNITASGPHKKSARIVGEVIGKYHPHGDTAVYDSMVRMSQDFSYRYPLIDGHGNFGSIDGDGAAAMRYTEARLSKVSDWLIKDIDMDTVPFMDNYDANEKEPVYLTGYFPNLLANGTMGIAVGMATSIPPHNLNEVVSGIVAYINNNDITVEELVQNHIKGPDFPTGALMTNGASMMQGYKTGRGSVKLRAKIDIEQHRGHESLVITEIPYQVNKAKVVEKIAELVKNKVITDIADIRDETNMKGIRIVIDLKRDANPDLVLSQLYKYTQLQTSFSINLLSLHNNIPVLLDLKSIIKYYVDFQIQIIIRRSIFEKNKLEKRLHILNALKTALDNIEEVIDIIRHGKDTESIREQLSTRFQLDEVQVKAILDLRLQRLSGLERDKIDAEIAEIIDRVAYLEHLIADSDEQNKVLIEQLQMIAEKFGDDRRTTLISDHLLNIDDEELIPDDKMMILLSKNGYVRRVNPEEFRVQKRGGRGISAINNKDEDVVDLAVMGKMRDWVLMFTNSGKVFRTKAYNIRQYSRTSKGLPITNFLEGLTKDDKITTILSIRNDKDKFRYLLFVTKYGIIKKTDITLFDSINRNGKIAINLRDDDELVAVLPTTGEETVFLSTASGKVIRIDENIVRPLSRTATGVKGIKLDYADEVVAAISSYGINELTTISSKGNFKKSAIDEYRISGRNGKGVKVMNLNEKTGNFKALLPTRETDYILIISTDGNLIKTRVKDIPLLSRTAAGVRGIRLGQDQEIAAVTLEYRKHGLEATDDEGLETEPTLVVNEDQMTVNLHQN